MLLTVAIYLEEYDKLQFIDSCYKINQCQQEKDMFENKKWDLRHGHVDGSDGADLADFVICVNTIYVFAILGQRGLSSTKICVKYTYFV